MREQRDHRLYGPARHDLVDIGLCDTQPSAPPPCQDKVQLWCYLFPKPAWCLPDQCTSRIRIRAARSCPFLSPSPLLAACPHITVSRIRCYQNQMVKGRLAALQNSPWHILQMLHRPQVCHSCWPLKLGSRPNAVSALSETSTDRYTASRCRDGTQTCLGQLSQAVRCSSQGQAVSIVGWPGRKRPDDLHQAAYLRPANARSSQCQPLKADLKTPAGQSWPCLAQDGLPLARGGGFVGADRRGGQRVRQLAFVALPLACVRVVAHFPEKPRVSRPGSLPRGSSADPTLSLLLQGLASATHGLRSSQSQTQHCYNKGCWSGLWSR